MSVADLVRYPRNFDAAAMLAAYFRVRPDELLITPGSDSAIRLICSYYALKVTTGGVLVHPRPHYDGWEQSARLHGFEVYGIEADPTNLARLVSRLVKVAQTVKGALIALSVPGAPLGGCVTTDQIEQIVEVARERDHLVVLDACYQAFNGPLQMQIERRGGPVLVVQSLSKSHGLAGARVAVVCGDPDLVAALGGGPLEQAVSAPSLLAAKVAVAHHELLRTVWTEIAEVRERFTHRLRDNGLPTVDSRGNFLAVQVGTAATAATVTQFLSDAGYRIRNLSDLPGLSGYVRFTVADAAATDRLADLLLTVTFTLSGPGRR